jgi:hypothetical protein
MTRISCQLWLSAGADNRGALAQHAGPATTDRAGSGWIHIVGLLADHEVERTALDLARTSTRGIVLPALLAESASQRKQLVEQQLSGSCCSFRPLLLDS